MISDLIGMAGVAGVTGLLFVIRHFVLTLGRHDSKRSVTPIPPLANHRLNRVSGEDDAWLLWTPDPDPQKDSSKRVSDQ